MIFIAHHGPPTIEQPGKEPLDFSAPSVSTQCAGVLGGHFAVCPVERNQLDAVLLHRLLVQSITVVGLIPDQRFGHVGHEALLEGCRDQFHCSWRSAFCPQSERKTISVCKAHDLDALAPLAFPYLKPSFLAGAKVPSTKHCLRSKPPASFNCCTSINSNCSITSLLTQFWNRRGAVWYGPYRGGSSCQGAPVRRIHNTPLNTLRRSLHGRPRPSSRTGSSGRMVSTTFYCLSVRSIHD